MKKALKENLGVICIAGFATLFGLALIFYVLLADVIRTEIISASSIRSNTFKVEEIRSKDDPDYDPVYNKTKTTHSTKYFRTVTVEVDGEQADIELSSEFKFMLPGQGKKITISRTYDGGYYWEHPLRNLIMGAVLYIGGLAVIISICRSGAAKAKPSKKQKKQKK